MESSADEFLPIDALGTPITIQVGERRFVATSTTLTEGSPVFKTLLSKRWNNAQPDGSYFVDADPTTFEHILRFFRSGVFPLFYDRSKGHDYGLYQQLLEQARFFLVTPLVKWLENRTYLKAVKITHTVTEVEVADVADKTVFADTEVSFHPKWTPEKVYVCPRGIFFHRGSPGNCGSACRRAQGDADDLYEDELKVKMVMITRETTFNRQIHEAVED